MIEPTSEERTALEFLCTFGVKFHRTHEHRLDCGCVVVGGWDTTTFEQAVGFFPCSPLHKLAANRVALRWGDPDVRARFFGVEATESAATLLGEEIVRG